MYVWIIAVTDIILLKNSTIRLINLTLNITNQRVSLICRMLNILIFFERKGEDRRKIKRYATLRIRHRTYIRLGLGKWIPAKHMAEMTAFPDIIHIMYKALKKSLPSRSEKRYHSPSIDLTKLFIKPIELRHLQYNIIFISTFFVLIVKFAIQFRMSSHYCHQI